VSLVDLHVHSSASDGRFSPEDIVNKAAELGLAVIALSDHDTVDGIAPALLEARKYPRLKVIPAVEISTDMPEGQVHILGYFIDYTDTELVSSLADFRSSRERRARGMVEKLGNLGMEIDWTRVQEIAGDGAIGRPHIARAMLEKNYIESFGEAFDRYIGHGGPAYVPRDKMTPAEAVKMILKASGLPVLAHPSTTGDPEKIIDELKAAGLIGIEAYYKDYTAEEIEGWVKLATWHNLIATGGTDYHGIKDAGEVMLGGTEVPMESVEKLVALADKKVLKMADMHHGI
jgi:predicted metal-dependent phosphoesterase TrpH